MPTLAATSQRHHGPAGEQLLARLRANTATAGAPEMSAARRLKWEKYHENAAESAESDSDSEEVDITESESDDEDPLADIL